MDQEFTWGTDIDILTLAHLVEAPILSYDMQTKAWSRYAPHNLDRNLNDDIEQMSMYLLHTSDHFHIVCSVQKSTLTYPYQLGMAKYVYYLITLFECVREYICHLRQKLILGSHKNT